MIHCFNHPVELALKDAFRTIAFEEVDSILCKLYYLYQNNPKDLSLQEERDNTVKPIYRILKLTWSMGNLKCLINESLVQDKSNMTHLTLLMSNYQDIKLSKYNDSFSAAEEIYRKAIVAVSDSMDSRFSDLRASPVFENLVYLLETKVSPEENFENFDDIKLQILVDHF